VGGCVNESGCILGIDVGGTRTKFGLVDLAERRLLAQIVRPTCVEGFDGHVASLRRGFADVCRDAGVDAARVRGCGIGLPGFVAGAAISGMWKTLTFLEGSRFLPAVEKTLGMPVRVDNDARLVALGEAWFADRTRAERLLSLTLGSGLGFGFVVGGRLQESTSINHLSGHIPIRPTTERCYCGFRGCLETLVNASGLVRGYGEASAAKGVGAAGASPRAEDVFEAAVSKDPAGVRAVRQWLADLATGVNAYVYLFGPDVIVFGGGLSRSLEQWLGELQTSVFAHPCEGYSVRLEVSRLQEQAGVLGAAALFFA